MKRTAVSLTIKKMQTQIIVREAGTVSHSCNHQTWEANTGGSWIRNQPGLHSKTLSQKSTCNCELLLVRTSSGEPTLAVASFKVKHTFLLQVVACIWDVPQTLMNWRPVPSAVVFRALGQRGDWIMRVLTSWVD
jgi:hypothetical protein